MSDLQVLIVGGGIAGSVAAYFLSRGGAHVTVIERASAVLAYGQGIDVEGTAREILQQMPGVMEEMRARATGEQGFMVVDDDGQPLGTIDAGTGSLVSDIEILRSDMCEILYKAAEREENVTFRFGTTVDSFSQSSEGVAVRFGDGSKQDFDIVIGADGLRSRTREMAFDSTAKQDIFEFKGVYAGFFSMPCEAGDGPRSRTQQSTGGRTCFIRPATAQKSQGYLMVTTSRNSTLDAACTQSKDVQKRAIKDTFGDIGGIVPRAVQQMMETNDFYFEQLAQIKMKSWSSNRVVLVGDAAYAPSPMTGCGTLLAIIGAYVLAGELTRKGAEVEAAFAAYEKACRPLVEKSQQIPLGGYAPKVLNPQTKAGIWLLRWIFRIVAWSGIPTLFSVFARNGQSFDLPSYSHLAGKSG